MASPAHRAIFQLHLWAALTVGGLLLFVALTGALMVFRPELDPRFNRALFTVAPQAGRLPLDAVVAAARQAHPEARVDYVSLVVAADSAVQVAFLDKQVAFVNPHTGELLGLRGRYEGFFGRCEQWHRLLLLGGVGKFMVRAGAMLTAFVVLTGFYLWLPPAWRAVKSGLTPNFQLKGRALHFNLHKVVGIYAGAVILMSALTGLPQSFDWFEHGTYHGWGALPPPPALHSVPPAGTTPPGSAPIQTWLEQARRLQPDAATVMIYLPRKPDAPVEIFTTSPGAAHDNARSYLFLDAYSGAVLRHTPYAQSTSGVKFSLLGMSLHYGQIGGWAGRLILLAGTMAVPVLAFTGVVMFLRRRSRPPKG